MPPGTRFRLHARITRNPGPYAGTSAVAIGVGSCGDKIKVDLQVEDNRIRQVKCSSDGCAYTAACTDALSTLASGRRIDEALALQPEDVVEALGGLPEDHLHCARLAVNTLGEAIEDYCRLHYSRLRGANPAHRQKCQ